MEVNKFALENKEVTCISYTDKSRGFDDEVVALRS